MTEMNGPEPGKMEPNQKEHSEEGIDRWLRHSMAAPTPSLPRDFEQRMVCAVRRSSQPHDRYDRILLIGYGLVSVVVSAVVMHGQGLDWGVISGTILAPLALVAIARAGWHASHRTSAP